jgi:hypothetical protein
VATDVVPAAIQLLNLLPRHKAGAVEVIGRHETVRLQFHCLNSIGDLRVVRQPAIVERDGEGERGAARTCQPRELTIELFERELVAVRCRRAETALSRVARVDVMEQQEDCGRAGDRDGRRAST